MSGQLRPVVAVGAWAVALVLLVGVVVLGSASPEVLDGEATPTLTTFLVGVVAITAQAAVLAWASTRRRASHVGRAAERLGMAQPPLSRAIAQLERRVGADLFVRTPRGMTLTSVGETLLREGRAALAAVEAAERRTRRAAEAPGRAAVVLTAKAGASSELMAKLLDAYAAAPDAVEVEVVLSPPGHQALMLRDGRADVAILHRPFDDLSGFDVDELATEEQVLILPAGHPASVRTSMTVAEASSIPDLPLPRWPHLDGTYPEGPGPELRDLTQVLQLVRLGRTAIMLPESARANVRDGLAVVPVVDAPRVTTVIAWPPHSTSTGVAGLVRAAGAL